MGLLVEGTRAENVKGSRQARSESTKDSLEPALLWLDQFSQWPKIVPAHSHESGGDSISLSCSLLPWREHRQEPVRIQVRPSRTYDSRAIRASRPRPPMCSPAARPPLADRRARPGRMPTHRASCRTCMAPRSQTAPVDPESAAPRHSAAPGVCCAAARAVDRRSADARTARVVQQRSWHGILSVSFHLSLSRTAATTMWDRPSFF